MATLTLPFDSLPPPSIAELKQWLAENDIKYHPSLVIESMRDQAGWTVQSQSFIHTYQHVASIPKTAILSIRNTELPGLADRFPVETTPTILPLSLALLYEMRSGQESRFFGYLQSLPRTLLALPLFWDVQKLAFGEDGLQALQWLEGTEAAREMAIKNATGQSYSDLTAFFQTNLHLFPPTPFSPSPPTMTHFLHAYALCSSRAFQTDVYHRPALLPFADLFNHSCDNHVHLETDDFVCQVCGRLWYCSLHDDCDPPTRLMGLHQEIEKQETDDCVLVVNRAVAGGEEVWNTYGNVGAGLSLVEYGYIDEEQEQGIVWGMGDVPCDVESCWVEEVGIELDQETLIGLGEGEKIFGLGALAQVSVATVASVFLARVSPDRHTFRRVLKLLESIWAADDGEDIPSEEKDQKTACDLASAMLDLLNDKIQALHRPDLSLERLFELKDDFSAQQGTRLRSLGLTACILERGLLETAVERWRAVHEALQQG